MSKHETGGYSGDRGGDCAEKSGNYSSGRGFGRGRFHGGRGRGRGKGRPPGLKGKEIGLYYRNLNLKKATKKIICGHSITLDPNREKEIRNLLDSIHTRQVHVKHEPDSESTPLTSEKYGHIEESAFKRRFLMSISGSIESNLNHCLSMKTVLERDETLDNMLKASLLQKMETSSRFRTMLQFREKLPAFGMRQQILQLIDSNQVVLISGETGCGKTTQVAQFILDDMIMKGRGSVCHVVCTQPRRISATSVAQRVAAERDEVCGEGSVGYQIRLDRKINRKKGAIVYCTTGILLQWLQINPGLTDVSHLVLDEIHERDVTSDFVLTILKDIIPKRPDLKVILMSATLNADKFSRYYDLCPSINIPGFTYPVTEYYLEDILEQINFEFKSAKKAPGWHKHLPHVKAKQGQNEDFKNFIEPYVRNLARQKKYSRRVLDTLLNPETEELNGELVAAVVQYICNTQDEGAVLVFVPGWSDIAKVNDLLTKSRNLPPSRNLIIPLHSMMPTTSQNSVFDRPPKGVRKIVIATNIAETSITIDDVVYVVDTGKIKMKKFDVANNICTLKAEWVSLANAKQRKGRAGRVQPGVCYHLYTRAREMVFDNYPLPEMMRTRLEEVILQAKILQLGLIKPFLQKVMDPPDPRAVDLSLSLLSTLNALDEDEDLTPLGYHLAKLPLDPQTGKMILMGAIFGCVDPIFSVAASLSFKDPFLVPLGKEREVDAKKQWLSHGKKSDHLLLAEVVRQWEEAESRGRSREYCWDNFLSGNTLNLLRDMKRQFAEYLHQMNFLPSNDPKDDRVNVNSHNLSLVKAIICAGLYPNVAIIRYVKRTQPGKVKIKLATAEDGKVEIHLRSVNATQHEFESPFLLYHLKLKSCAIYLHDTSMIHPLPLVFFGQKIDYSVTDNEEVISISDNIRFRCIEQTANIIKELRRQLDKLLEQKVTHPGWIDWHTSSDERAVLRAIVELVTYEDNRLMMRADDRDDEFSD